MKVTFIKKVITCGGCEIHLYKSDDFYVTHIVMVFDPDDNLFYVELAIGEIAGEEAFKLQVIEQGGDRED